MRIVERLREAADLFREHPVYNSEGDSVLLTVNAALDDEAAALLEQAEAALEAMLSRHAHKFECHYTRPTSEWAEHGSAGTNCVCEIGLARALLAKLHEGGE